MVTAAVYHRGLATTPTSKDDWQSPECVLERVRRLGPIFFDPCSTAANPAGAERWCTAEANGLIRPWPAGLSYVNFPYSQAKEWATKIAAEYHRGCEVVTLCPARTDTRWFFEAGWNSATAICFWRGRLTFTDPATGEPAMAWNQRAQRMVPAPAPFPSAILYHGDQPDAFHLAFADAGKVVRL